MNAIRWSALITLAVFAALAAGCAQDTTATSAQPTRQIQAPVADQAAQGSKSDVRVYIVNAPGGNSLPDDGNGALLDLANPENAVASIGETSSTETGSAVKDTRAGYVQSGFTLNIHTGGSSTGAQATGATGSQASTPGASISQSPNQEPRANVTTPIAVGLPGSAPQATGTGALEGGSATTTADQQAQLRTALIKAASGDLSALQTVFQQLFGETLPVSTMPAKE